MTEFKKGDYVIRINDSYGSCKLGQTYEVEDYKRLGTYAVTLVLMGLPGSYLARNFILSPISDSPLMKALK